MNKSVFSIGSVTHAIKAQRILGESSIPSKVVKTQNDQRGRGCVYGIEVDSAYHNTAVHLLTLHGVNIGTR